MHFSNCAMLLHPIGFFEISALWLLLHFIVETIATIFGSSYCSKLRPISGTHNQLQVQGCVSADAYPSRKLRIVSLNKRILKPNRLHQAIEKELKGSLINIPTSAADDVRGHGKTMYLYSIVLGSVYLNIA